MIWADDILMLTYKSMNCSCFNHAGIADYTGVVDKEITFRAGDSMQCIHIDIVDDRNVLEEMLESFVLTLTALEPFVTIPSEQESITINIFEDPLDD